MAPNIISQIPERFLTDIRSIIKHGRQTAYAAAGQATIMTYWNVGQRIVEEEQNGKARAEYGKQIIPLLAEQLTKDYGTGYGRRYLVYYRQFYLTFTQKEILHEVVQNLTWTHIRRILSVSNLVSMLYANMGKRVPNWHDFFQEEFPYQLWVNIENVITNLSNMPLWKTRSCRSPSSMENRSMAFWKTIFETGVAPIGEKVLANPIYTKAMIAPPVGEG